MIRIGIKKEGGIMPFHPLSTLMSYMMLLKSHYFISDLEVSS